MLVCENEKQALAYLVSLIGLATIDQRTIHEMTPDEILMHQNSGGKIFQSGELQRATFLEVLGAVDKSMVLTAVEEIRKELIAAHDALKKYAESEVQLQEALNDAVKGGKKSE
jgi:hypothetical protein